MVRLICFLSIFTAMILTSQAQCLFTISKDEPTKQFYTDLAIGNSSLELLLDLGTNLTWLNCHKLQSLKSLHTVACDSLSCDYIPGNGCHDVSCLYQQPNPLGSQNVTGRVVQDTAFLYTTDGNTYISRVSLRIFTFSCARDSDLQGLALPVDGVLSLSPGTSSFTIQVTSGFDVTAKLAICLPSHGVGRFYVGVNYVVLPFDNSTNPIKRTLTPMRTGSGDYLITVQSMYVGGTPLTLNPLLLGGVGAKLSTVVRYTVLQTDVYNALAQSFTLKAEAMGIAKVSSVAPFKDCFDARNISGKDMTGPNVPEIAFGLPGKTGDEVKWGFYGANTVVKVNEMVMCLAFYDGGINPKEVIVIGTYQLQDYLLEFDLTTSVFSFSDSLLLHDTNCSDRPS